MVEEGSPYLGEARGESDLSFCYRGEFKILRQRRQRKRQKSNRRNWQNNNSTRASRFFPISLPSLHDYDYFTFYRGPKQATAKYSFSF